MVVNGDNEEVHPIELTAQNLLDGPLESLNLNLKSLQESQTILFNILHQLENCFTETANNLRPGSVPLTQRIVSPVESFEEVDTPSNEQGTTCSDDVVHIDHDIVENNANKTIDLDSYLERLVALRKKITNIERILNRVEVKISDIEAMIDEGIL